MIQDLLKAIHSFYPVGMNDIMMKYDGFAAFQDILSDKINVVMEGGDPSWNNLSHELGRIFAGHPLMDQSYNQFPSYQFCITLLEKDDREMKIERRLLVNISLLCPYYTLFFETKMDIKLHNSKSLPQLTTSVFNLHTTDDPAKSKMEEIRKLVETHFKGYQFAYHKTLFEYHIDGCGTYSNWQEYEAGRKYPVYSYLFDSHLMLDSIMLAD